MTVTVRLDDGEELRAASDMRAHHAHVVADRLKVDLAEIVSEHSFASFLYVKCHFLIIARNRPKGKRKRVTGVILFLPGA